MDCVINIGCKGHKRHNSLRIITRPYGFEKEGGERRNVRGTIFNIIITGRGDRKLYCSESPQAIPPHLSGKSWMAARYSVPLRGKLNGKYLAPRVKMDFGEAQNSEMYKLYDEYDDVKFIKLGRLR